MPMPLEDVSDPQPRRVVPTESAAATEYISPDDPVPQPAGTWPVIVMPTPLWDVNDPQPSRVVTTGFAPVRSHPPPTSQPARTFPFEYLRRLFRQLRRGSGSSTLNIVIEPPSVSETSQTTMSASANRSLLQDDVHQYRRRPSHSHWQSQSQPPSRRPFSYSQRSEMHHTSWPANFIPGRGTISSSSSSSPSSPSSKPGPGLERDYRQDHSHPVSARASYYRNRGGDRDRENRRDSGKDYERERDRDRDREDPEDTDLDEEPRRSPPSPIQRPVLLFDIDEEQ
ncbi:hypothetical protein OG21DRAFT_902552 [Imleria badia]|nr:hypothetical protein OG21DRAFT_902552 [Imleria badia]